MKVHFAGNREQCGESLLKAGVRYRLESFFDIACRGRSDGVDVWNRFNHTIIDSGLFTLMFGAEASKGIDEKFCVDWLDRYVEFINTTPFRNASFVEMDVQKKLGIEAAWELRHEMRRRVNKGTLVNVYHLEDGNPDRLIEHAEYIAISLPELRFNVSDRERQKITRYIASKAKSKGKRVHLLGCTEKSYLRDFRFCDSCDSTSWQSGFRFGSLKTSAFGKVSIGQIRANRGDDPNRINDVFWSALFSLREYGRVAGSQH